VVERAPSGVLVAINRFLLRWGTKVELGWRGVASAIVTASLRGCS
jgi:hypothetical protein